MSLSSSPSLRGPALALACLMLLTACGGGSSSRSQRFESITLTGRLVGGAGLPSAEAVVTLQSDPPQTVTTSANGLFEFSLPPGNWPLQVQIGGATVLDRLIEADGRAPAIPLGDLTVTTTVRGVVLGGGGEALAGTTVSLDGPVLQVMTTANDGQFAFEAVAGQRLLSIRYQSQLARIESFAARLEENTDLGELRILTRIAGRLLDGRALPLIGATVSLDTTPDTYLSSDANGAFEADVLPGTYRLDIRDSGELLDSRSVTVGEPRVELGALVVLQHVAGRIRDAQGRAIAGAQVLSDSLPPRRAATDSAGRFAFDVPLGASRICVEQSGVVGATALIPAGPAGSPRWLGELVLDVSRDRDGDGLSDAFEFAGWTIQVDTQGDGNQTTRRVFSDPAIADTDGDGLSDSEELASRSDPDRTDSDGDGLSDPDEIRIYKSLPNDVDSDDDARLGAASNLPNPALFDGQEVQNSGTSPILADTDGDSFSDHEEIIGGGNHPLVADQPLIDIEVIGDPSIVLNATVNQSSMTQAVQRTLIRDTNTQTRADTVTSSYTTENEQSIGGEGSLSSSGGGALSITGSASWKQTTFNERVVGFTNESVREAQQEVENLEASSTSVTYSDGGISVAIRVTNRSNLALRVEDLKIIAYRVRPTSNAGVLQVIGSLFQASGGPLNPSPGSSTSGIVAPPGSSFTFVAQNAALNYQPILELLRDSGGLLFEVGSYRLQKIDGLGQVIGDYDAIAEDVVERCAAVVIDYGDGQIERHAVACNTERDANGQARGRRLGEIMGEVLGIDYETTLATPTPGAPAGRIELAGRRILTRIGNAATTPSGPKTRWWFVAGPNISEEVNGVETILDFDDIMVRPGDRITLAHMIDEDGDGLVRSEEALFGTSDQELDTDRDGLSDRFEAKQGWTVSFVNCGDPSLTFPTFDYRVFSSPRLPDSDQDGLTDFEEVPVGLPSLEFLSGNGGSLTASVAGLGTDPTRRDTDAWDGDNLEDLFDPCPRDPPALAGGNLPSGELSLYYRMDAVENLVRNGLVQTLDRSGDFNNACLENRFDPRPYDPSAQRGGISLAEDRRGRSNRAFQLSQQPALSESGFIRVLPRPALAPFSRQFTIAMWVRFAGDPNLSTSPSGDQTLFEQQGWLALRYRGQGGKIGFELPAPGGNPLIAPSFVAEADLRPQVGAWTFVCFVVSEDPANAQFTVEAYADTNPWTRSVFPTAGTLPALSTVTAPGALPNPTLGGVQVPLHIGASFRSDGTLVSTLGLEGAVDDFRLYDRALSSSEVSRLWLERGLGRP